MFSTSILTWILSASLCKAQPVRCFHRISHAHINTHVIGNLKNNSKVTLLGGWMRPREDFKFLARKLEEKGFCVILPEFRGSGRHEVGDSFLIRDLANDIQSVWSQLGIQQTILMGVSMGGMVAQEVLMEKSEVSIPKAILISTTAKSDDVTRNEQIPIQVKKYVSDRYIDRKPKNVETMQSDFDQLILNKDRNIPIWQRRAIQQWRPPQVRPHSCKSKAYVFHGDEDKVFSLQSAEELSKIWDAKLEVFSNHGHLLLVEDPRNVVEKVLEILNDMKD